LADWKTLDDFKIPTKNGKFVLSWAFHPNALPLAVPASTLHMAAMRGMDVTVLRPEGFELPAEVMKKAKAAAILSGGTVTETNDRYEAMQDAHVIYAKSWISAKHYNDKQMESEARKDLVDWRVKDSWFNNALPSCRFMHCLPVRRGVVVDDSVLDGSRSIVIHEARNRMLTQMAVLHQMMK
jgi:N-acetylornithine carbamoyltransferase